MTAYLKRALAAVLTEAIPGLHAYADDLVNTQKRYPELVIAEIVSDRKPMGCGRDNVSVRDGSGTLSTVGDLTERMVNLRLTLTAPSSETASGTQIITDLAAQIEDGFQVLSRGPDRVQVIDPVSGDDQRVTAIRFLDARDLPPDITGEPFLFRRALSYRVTQQLSYERPVEHTIDRVGMTNGGVNV